MKHLSFISCFWWNGERRSVSCQTIVPTYPGLRPTFSFYNIQDVFIVKTSSRTTMILKKWKYMRHPPISDSGVVRAKTQLQRSASFVCIYKLIEQQNRSNKVSAIYFYVAIAFTATLNWVTLLSSGATDNIPFKYNFL